jgi:uncharacterized membrane protein
MIQLFLKGEMSLYASLIVMALTLVVFGFMSLDKKGKFESTSIIGGIFVGLLLFCAWQFVLLIVIGIGILMLPFGIGYFLKQISLKAANGPLKRFDSSESDENEAHKEFIDKLKKE